MFIVDAFNFVVYEPLYNGLVFVMWFLPWSDAGLAVIVFTVLVRLLLFPLSRKAVKTQMKMRSHEDELKEIKEKHKEDKQAQAQEMMAFYKEKGINPFSSFLLILIQLPIIIALYHIFLSTGLPEIDQELLYSFVQEPELVTVQLFGLSFLSLAGKSWVLAVFASITSFFQIRYSMPPLKPKTSSEPNFKEDLMRSMNIQMRYVFPVIVFFIAWSISGAIALYWITSNLFTLGQELVVRREMQNQKDTEKTPESAPDTTDPLPEHAVNAQNHAQSTEQQKTPGARPQKKNKRKKKHAKRNR
ncbi:MAG: YidC/Oxa1 family membrane protein insertase [Candidatus Paceibacterota bacterium]